MIRTVLLALGLAMSAGIVMNGAASQCPAEDFSIENSVYDGREQIGRSTTLFTGEKVYDLLVSPDEAIVFDVPAGRISLIDNINQVRCDLSFDEISQFCDRVRDRARASGSESARFAADPDFRETLDPETNEIVLAGTWLEYRARATSPKSAEVLKSYEAYVLRQAQLNTVLNPGASPPSARIKLNEALARRQQIPEQVSLRRISADTGAGKLLRAEHHYTWRLGEPDLRRIAEVDDRLAKYRVVPFTTYLDGLNKSASR